MPRPALSATRALEFIDLLAAAPERVFTLSELAQRTGTNLASCHAILAALVQHGHLVRHPVHRTYRLAPALFAIGQTVKEQDPLLARAVAAAEALADAHSCEVLLTARAGEDIIALERVARGPLPSISMRVGERASLRPPLGATFVAWSDDAEIAAWLHRGDAKLHARDDLARLSRVRERGFLVVLRSSPQDALRGALADAGSPASIEQQRLRAMMEALYGGVYELDEIDLATEYSVSIISAPLFDAYGQVSYSLSLGGLPARLRGTELTELARNLLSVCDDVMREAGTRRRTQTVLS